MRDRIKNVLSNLKNVQEDLLALSDDLWLEIDHNYNAAIERGVAFKKDFNLCNAEFTQSANKISKLIQDYTNTSLYVEDKSENIYSGKREKERLIKELNRKEPHTLNEDFKYKRPYGFVLQDTPYKNKLTWSEIYLQICTHLQKENPSLFETLDSDPKHISNRNNKYFSKSPNELRSPQKCGPSIHVEMNLSANQIRNSIKRLLNTYKIDYSELTIYLREDRDAQNA